MLKSVMACLFLGSVAWASIPGFGDGGLGDPPDQAQAQAPQTHFVEVSGTAASLTVSPDTVHCHPGDIIVWKHSGQDTSIRVNLERFGGLLPPEQLIVNIPAGRAGARVVPRVLEQRVFPYDVAVISPDGTVVEDPYIDIEPPPPGD